MLTANDHYDKLYGEFGLSPNDAARWVFASGWNSALTELITRLDKMPIERDTRASFAVFIGNMMHIDPNEIRSVQ